MSGQNRMAMFACIAFALLSGAGCTVFEECDVDGVLLLQAGSKVLPKRHNKALQPASSKVNVVAMQHNATQSEPKAGGAAPEASPSSTEKEQVSQEYPTYVWVFGGLMAVVAITLFGSFAALIRKMNEQAAAAQTDAQGSKVFKIVFYGILYIAASVALIKYNKFLITDGRFPFAINLTLGHQVAGSLCLFLVYKLRPALFPSLSDEEKNKEITWRFFGLAVCPIALCFSGQLVLSNSAYQFSSVAFLQMMKEGNIVLVYLLSLLAGMERFDSARARILFCLFLSTTLTIQGELNFDFTGFAIQGTSQFLECSKIVLQAILLSAAGSKGLDALSYNLLVQPATAVLVLVYLLVIMSGLSSISTASAADYAAWWPHLAANALTALSLNLTASVFIANTSAVGFIVAGILKDVTLILIDVLISGTQISQLQVVAFSCQVMFVGGYSLFKTFSAPDKK
eukprot:gb/GFBE01012084.1/.p1 GENE.gb/GFBE01012084.1/~~gb/GFBE01012084.1/.p1  ORF type:complete len:455 (+),score=109.66 gb/GFBE01012084.1/:1-1365(+)